MEKKKKKFSLSKQQLFKQELKFSFASKFDFCCRVQQLLTRMQKFDAELEEEVKKKEVRKIFNFRLLRLWFEFARAWARSIGIENQIDGKQMKKKNRDSVNVMKNLKFLWFGGSSNFFEVFLKCRWIGFITAFLMLTSSCHGFSGVKILCYDILWEFWYF